MENAVEQHDELMFSWTLPLPQKFWHHSVHNPLALSALIDCFSDPEPIELARDTCSCCGQAPNISKFMCHKIPHHECHILLIKPLRYTTVPILDVTTQMQLYDTTGASQS